MSRRKLFKKGKKFGVRVAAGICASVLVLGARAAWADRSNDVVFHQDKYIEFFKQEGKGDKNYLYTRTEQPAPPPGKCYVYTGNSEQSVAVVCNTNPS